MKAKKVDNEVIEKYGPKNYERYYLKDSDYEKINPGNIVYREDFDQYNKTGSYENYKHVYYYALPVTTNRIKIIIADVIDGEMLSLREIGLLFDNSNEFDEAYQYYRERLYWDDRKYPK